MKRPWLLLSVIANLAAVLALAGTVQASKMTLVDANGLTLGNVSATGNLNATAGTDLTLSGTVNVASLDLTATLGDITQTAGTLRVTAGPTNLTAGDDMSDGFFTPGEKQCKFCKAKATCPALRAEMAEVVGGADAFDLGVSGNFTVYISARGTTGMRRSRATSTSGLSAATAVDTTTVSPACGRPTSIRPK